MLSQLVLPLKLLVSHRSHKPMNKLMIGGGELSDQYRQQGWTVLDGEPSTNPDILAILPPLPQFDHEWDVIQAVHTIEHFYYEDARQLIGEIYRSLAPGGLLVLEQANLEWIAKAILGQVELPTVRYPWMAGETKWLMEWALYPQPKQIQGNGLQHHKYMYTPRSLSSLVADCGFSDIKILPSTSHVPERDFRLEAIK